MKYAQKPYESGDVDGTEPWLTGVDPRAKIVGCLIALIGAGVGGGWASGVWLLAAFAYFFSGERIASLASALLPVVLLCFAGLVLHGVSVGGTLIHPMMPLSREGLWSGSKLASQLLAAASLARILALTTTTAEIAASLSWLLKPLGRAGIPVGEFFSTVSVALSIIPDIKGADAFRGKGKGRFEELGARLFDRAQSAAQEGGGGLEQHNFKAFAGSEWLTVCAALAAAPLSLVLS